MGANAHAGAGASFSDRAALAPASRLTHRAAGCRASRPGRGRGGGRIKASLQSALNKMD